MRHPELIPYFVGGVVVFSIGYAIAHLLSSRNRATRALGKARPVAIRHFADGGVAKVIGKARATRPLKTAPLTGRPCIYYQVEVIEVERNMPSTLLTEEDGDDFVVSDGTGDALIRVDGAKFALVYDGADSSTLFDGASARAERLLTDHGHSSTGLLLNRQLQFREGILEDGERVAVMGVGRWRDAPESDAGGYRENPKRLEMRPSKKTPLLISDAHKTFE